MADDRETLVNESLEKSSEKGVILPNIGEIAAHEIGEYFKNLDLNVKCEICGTSNWGVTADIGGDPPVLSTYADGDFETASTKLPIIILECAHCGNLKLLSRNRVANYLKNR